MVSVLFVCLGNICRSPMAEAVFRAKVERAGLADQIHVASAGTGDWHLGERPHRGTLRELERHGVPLGDIRASRITLEQLETVDYIVAMDVENLNVLRRMVRREGFDDVDVRLLMEFAAEPNAPMDIPDPYYERNFDQVYAMIDDATTGLLEWIRERERL
ncbi:MAG TPA: low molecular weight phosphotyrosine protein phosphatase [Chloroflexi bacterium]|nr:low molecular weight phosphotyrosine protein phosphatase [Chloroflexota bacterium]